MHPATQRARSLVLAIHGITLTGLAASLVLALAITVLRLPDPPPPWMGFQALAALGVLAVVAALAGCLLTARYIHDILCLTRLRRHRVWRLLLATLITLCSPFGLLLTVFATAARRRHGQALARSGLALLLPLLAIPVSMWRPATPDVMCLLSLLFALLPAFSLTLLLTALRELHPETLTPRRLRLPVLILTLYFAAVAASFISAGWIGREHQRTLAEAARFYGKPLTPRALAHDYYRHGGPTTSGLLKARADIGYQHDQYDDSWPEIPDDLLKRHTLAASPAELDELDAWVARHADFYGQLQQTTRGPLFRMTRNYQSTPLYALLLPELSVYRSMARYWLLRLRYSIRRHDAAGAWQALQGISWLRDSAGADALLISQLVSIAIERIRLDALSELLSAGLLPPERLRQLQQELVRLESAWTRGIRDYCWGESIFSLDATRALSLGPTPLQTANAWFEFDTYRNSPQLTRLESLFTPFNYPFLDSFLKQNDIACIRSYQTVAALNLKRETAPPPAAMPPLPLCAIMTKMTLSAVAPATGKFNTITALDRAAMAAIGILLHRQQTGVLPASWSDVAPDCLPAPARDFFGGEPLRLQVGDLPLPTPPGAEAATARLRAGFKVYSIGADGKDDGGTPDQAPPRKMPGDLVFSVYLP